MIIDVYNYIFFLLVGTFINIIAETLICIQLHESIIWSNFDSLTLQASSNYMQLFLNIESKQFYSTIPSVNH